MISAWVEQYCSDLPGLHSRLAGLPSPYGDGTSSLRSVAAISVLLTQRTGRRGVLKP
jgi:hypothetical protein